ncbi:MAG: hypothetical protein ACOCPY_01005 [Halorubrum sp.]
MDSIDGPQLRPTASAGDGSNAGARPRGDGRVREDPLTAERDLPVVERDLLDERVRALTDEVEALEAEVEALEATVEAKERQRQQMIDNYESIVAARRAPDRSAETDTATSVTSDGDGPLAAAASRIRRATAWLRPGRE